MKRILPLIAGLSTVVSLHAAEPKAAPKAPEPHPTTQTFYIANIECDSCVSAITESLKKVKSVTKVDGLDSTSGYANVSFDSHADSYHQVAQAIADAEPQHGKKYEVTMKLRVPDYAKGDNAAKVDAIFAKQKNDVRITCVDKAKGEFVLTFLPLTTDPKKQGPQGFNGGKIGHPIHDPAPKGLGLTMTIVREGAATKAPAKSK